MLFSSWLTKGTMPADRLTSAGRIRLARQTMRKPVFLGLVKTFSVQWTRQHQAQQRDAQFEKNRVLTVCQTCPGIETQLRFQCPFVQCLICSRQDFLTLPFRSFIETGSQRQTHYTPQSTDHPTQKDAFP
jgi:hypothetical protein